MVKQRQPQTRRAMQKSESELVFKSATKERKEEKKHYNISHTANGQWSKHVVSVCVWDMCVSLHHFYCESKTLFKLIQFPIFNVSPPDANMLRAHTWWWWQRQRSKWNWKQPRKNLAKKVRVKHVNCFTHTLSITQLSIFGRHHTHTPSIASQCVPNLWITCDIGISRRWVENSCIFRRLIQSHTIIATSTNLTLISHRSFHDSRISSPDN